jgi:hypothetical protein
MALSLDTLHELQRIKRHKLKCTRIEIERLQVELELDLRACQSVGRRILKEEQQANAQG